MAGWWLASFMSRQKLFIRQQRLYAGVWDIDFYKRLRPAQIESVAQSNHYCNTTAFINKKSVSDYYLLFTTPARPGRFRLCWRGVLLMSRFYPRPPFGRQFVFSPGATIAAIFPNNNDTERWRSPPLKIWTISRSRKALGYWDFLRIRFSSLICIISLYLETWD